MKIWELHANYSPLIFAKEGLYTWPTRLRFNLYAVTIALSPDYNVIILLGSSGKNGSTKIFDHRRYL